MRTRANLLGGTALLALVMILSTGPVPVAASRTDETITLDGRFGSFVALGDPTQALRAAGPDRVEDNPADEYRVASRWLYFNDRGIRVRVCADDGRVGSVNATVAPATRGYVTEAGVRIGDSLDEVRDVYGDRLERVEEVQAPVHSVEDPETGNLLTFGFDDDGAMRWVALGAPRANGYTCGRPS